MSAIKLSTPSSGSISLSPADTASNLTITVPAVSATMATLTTPSFATTIGVGGATPAASGAGITFPATQSASSDANTLDDYEEGDWTPSLGTSGTNFSSVSYSIRTGRYIKIGRFVNISLRFTTSAVTIGSATGNVRITGLPFAPSSNSNAGGVVSFNANWGSNAPNFGVVFDTETIINLYRNPASGGYSAGSPILVADVATGGNSNYVYINLSYETTA